VVGQFLDVNVTIMIDIGHTDHLVEFLVGEWLITQGGHGVTELVSGDLTIAIAIEDHESLDQLFFLLG